MPLRNRVDPSGAIHATPERGEFFGNRGCIHNSHGEIVRKPPVRRWIICVTEFKGRRRKLLQPGRYTELFFLDEVTGLAAGHRPCFECRREAALAYAHCFAAGHGQKRPSADEMDFILDDERSWPAKDSRRQITLEEVANLPDGAMLRHDDTFHAVRAGKLLPWSFGGYGNPAENFDALGQGPVYLVTPRSSLRALSAGYDPQFHASVRESTA